ncbi:MAG: VWA domain-containing protein, partial [Pseudomonadota bacterium]
MRALLLASALCAGTALQAEDTTMLVMDASGSMWGQIDGVNKVVIARDVVRDSLGAAAVTQSLGLIAYGHNRKGDCSDIEVLVPPAKGTNSAIAAAVAAINPKGKTPLTEAVRRAAAVMQHTENRATVVLVTDGLETCDADPCALARELEQSGVDFTAHVVGFGLSRADGAAVACLAEETGGRYFDAGNAGELAAALSVAVAEDIPQQAVVEEPPQIEPRHNLQINVQLTADSPPLELGQIDKMSLDLIRQSDGKTSRVAYEPYVALKVEPGEYIVRAKYEGGEVDMPVSVEQFDTAHATMVLNAGVVDFQAIPLAPDLIDQRMIS